MRAFALICASVKSFSLSWVVTTVNGKVERYNKTGRWFKEASINEKKKALDNWLSAKTGNEDVPTSAVVVIHRNEIAYEKAVNTKLTRMYPIASFTKIFVSLAVLQLVDRGMISLDDPISKHLEVTLENNDLKTDPITFRGIAWNVWTERGKPVSMLHGSLWKGSGGLIRIFPAIKAGFVFMSNPPNHKNSGFISFFNRLKGRIVRLISQLRIEGNDPLKFRATFTDKSEMKHFIGKYKDPGKNKLIEITVKNEKQLAWKYNKSSGVNRLRPISTINYVYLSKDDSLPLDFIWEKDRIVALIVKHTYYKKL